MDGQTDLSDLKILRHELHSCPEIAGSEKNTAGILLKFLKKCKPDQLYTNVGGYGILACWDSHFKGPSVLLRADMDALPIEEENIFSYISKNKGISHKCGHDGHMTILCACARELLAHKPDKGKVFLLFQPAEENGTGAQKVIKDPVFQQINPDFVFALHNLPGYPMHQIVLKEGSFSSSVNSIIIKLKGKTSHAAEPENGINPSMALSNILQETNKLEQHNVEREDMSIITPIYIKSGKKAYGTSAGYAEIHLTLRCWEDHCLRKLEKEIENICHKYAQKYKLQLNISYTQTFHATVNDPVATDIVRTLALQNNFNIYEARYPFKWGEDFGLFTKRFRGCMFGLGSGMKTPALHNPDYDFPDELIKTGKSVFLGILNQILYSKKNV